MIYYIIRNMWALSPEIPEETTTEIVDKSIVFKTDNKDEAINVFKRYYMSSGNKYKLFEVTTETIENN